MATYKEVDSYLKDFKQKMRIWDIVFRDDRGKNFQTLIDLEITPNSRKEILDFLLPVDFSEGPIEDVLYGSTDLWVFGKTIKKKEIYIKITMGKQGSNVICISFHLAEYKMNYPLK
jgi:hypothetical protein